MTYVYGGKKVKAAAVEPPLADKRAPAEGSEVVRGCMWRRDVAFNTYVIDDLVF